MTVLFSSETRAHRCKDIENLEKCNFSCQRLQQFACADERKKAVKKIGSALPPGTALRLADLTLVPALGRPTFRPRAETRAGMGGIHSHLQHSLSAHSTYENDYSENLTPALS